MGIVRTGDLTNMSEDDKYMIKSNTFLACNFISAQTTRLSCGQEKALVAVVTGISEDYKPFGASFLGETASICDYIFLNSCRI